MAPWPRFPSSWFGALLGLVAFVVVVLLTGQAWYAHHAHRRVAEEVLEDWATLAAGAFVERSVVAIGYEIVYPMASALARWPSGSELPSPEELGRTQQQADPDGIAMILRKTADGRSVSSGDHPLADSPALIGWIEGLVPSEWPRLDEENRWAFRQVEVDGRSVVIAFVARADPEPTESLWALVIDPTAVDRRLEAVARTEALLPDLLLESDDPVTLDLRVTDSSGTERVRRERPGRRLTGRAAFGEAYRGLLAGWTVEVGLDAAVALRLIPGGLPASRRPLLLVLPFLAAVLLLAILVVLERHRRLARSQADFLAQVSHELRTPLTQMRLFTETLLLDRARSEAERRRALEVIGRESRRLGWLVDNVLRVAGGGRIPPATAVTIDVREAVERAVFELRPLADSRRSRIEVGVEGDEFRIGDRDALHQILLNLLSNALKYGPDGQTVLVSVRAESQRTRIEVEDEGPGVPEEDRRRIWRRFVRLDRGQSSGGIGLGLAVTKELVEAEGGSVDVTDRRSGSRGARFIVSLPSRAEAAPPAENGGESA